MREIVSRLHKNRQVELAKSILEANECKVEKMDESALDDFWSIYDGSPDGSEQLRKIATHLGIDPDVEPSEEDAKKILAVYRGELDPDSESADLVYERLFNAVKKTFGNAEKSYRGLHADEGISFEVKGVRYSLELSRED